jgi:hypothetical protein
MDPLSSNPFIVFTFLAAPAVMTNAAAVMSLTTANRIARAVDRSRALVAELADPGATPADIRAFRVREVEVARERAVLLNRALASFQLAFGSFATATLVALLGAFVGHFELRYVGYGVFLLVLACMAVAVGGVARGAWLVVRESRMAYAILREETAHVLRVLIVPPDEQVT